MNSFVDTPFVEAEKILVMREVPNPSPDSGMTKSGQFSCQTISTSRLLFWRQVRSMVPPSWASAPYFRALVPSSCSASAR